MTVISTQEFVANQNKYFDMAIEHDIHIKRGLNMYQLICTNFNNTNISDEILEPDDDLRRAISMDEFLTGVKEDLRQIFKTGKR